MMRSCILVVDDVPDAREVLSYALEVEGYRVVEAGSGGDAIEQAITHQPLAIVMDLQIPGVDGIEATRRIKADDRVRHIPVIAYTAYPKEILEPDLFSAVLTKPCPFDQLLRTIAQWRPARITSGAFEGRARASLPQLPARALRS